jgi:hypothetical protein
MQSSVQIPVQTPDKAEPVDIRDVSVDRSLPKRDRIAEFVRQLRDPYHYKCGDFTVTAKFAENGATLEDCLRQLMSQTT